MATVESWFEGFTERLTNWLPRPDWPALGDETGWQAWFSACTRHGVKEHIANEAAILLAENPPAFPAQLLKTFLAHVKTLQAAGVSDAQADAGLSDRESAKLASCDCSDCYGEGLTFRYRHDSLGKSNKDGRPFAKTVQCYCLCPYGRWLEHEHRTKSPAVHKNIYDLDDEPALWDEKYKLPPMTEAEEDRALVSFGEWWRTSGIRQPTREEMTPEQAKAWRKANAQPVVPIEPPADQKKRLAPPLPMPGEHDRHPIPPRRNAPTPAPLGACPYDLDGPREEINEETF